MMLKKILVKKILVTFFIGLFVNNILGQKVIQKSVGTNNKTQRPLSANSNPKEQLKNAVLKSQKSQSISVKVELIVQNKQFVTAFEYLAPNRYSLFETTSGIAVKEAVEISRQRFQKKDNQWVKTRKDYFLLREQLDLYFPIKFTSLKSDIIKIKEVKVTYLGEDFSGEKKYSKYQYTISYKGFDNIDSGVAWVNQTTKFLEKLETENFGLFGATKALFNYHYDKEIKIEEPKNFIVKDWIN